MSETKIVWLGVIGGLVLITVFVILFRLIQLGFGLA